MMMMMMMMSNDKSNNNDDSISKHGELNKNILKLLPDLDWINNGNRHLPCHKLDQNSSKCILYKLIMKPKINKSTTFR